MFVRSTAPAIKRGEDLEQQERDIMLVCTAIDALRANGLPQHAANSILYTAWPQLQGEIDMAVELAAKEERARRADKEAQEAASKCAQNGQHTMSTDAPGVCTVCGMEFTFGQMRFISFGVSRRSTSDAELDALRTALLPHVKPSRPGWFITNNKELLQQYGRAAGHSKDAQGWLIPLSYWWPCCQQRSDGTSCAEDLFKVACKCALPAAQQD